MRYFLSLFILVCLIAVVGLTGQERPNAAEKKASDELTIGDPVKIAGQDVPAGRYRVTCDRGQVTFEAITGKNNKFTFPCKGKQLEKKAGATQLRLNVEGKDRVVTSLLLRGSAVEHTF